MQPFRLWLHFVVCLPCCRGSLRAQQPLRMCRAAGQGLQPHSTAPVGMPTMHASQHGVLCHVEASASPLCCGECCVAHLINARAFPAPASVLRRPAVRVAAAAAPVLRGAAVAAALAAPAVPRQAARVAAAAASGTRGPAAPPPAVPVGRGPAAVRAGVAPLALQLPAAGVNRCMAGSGRGACAQGPRACSLWRCGICWGVTTPEGA